MAQLSIFNDMPESKEAHKKSVPTENTWEIFVDGASRNNPGQSGVGIYIRRNNKDFIRTGFYLGIKTNNEAEYLALLIALFIIEEKLEESDIINITSDSQLLINQLKRIFAVKKAELKRFYNIINIFLDKYHYRLHHVLRDKNKIADGLANIAVDEKRALTKEIIAKMKQHDIKI